MNPREHPSWRKFLVRIASATLVAGASRSAAADVTQPVIGHVMADLAGGAPPSGTGASANPITLGPDAPSGLPVPPKNDRFVQFGVGFTTEFVAAGDALCTSDAKVVPHCILGSGAGLVFPRIGWRSPGHWYLGGAYEFSKQDASTVYVLPILQQLRGEARYYFLQGHVGTPFIEGSAGVAAYGDKWTVDAFGPAESLAFGVEAQISQTTVVGVTLAYRVMHFGGFTDSAGNDRNPGFSQLLGLNVLLEARDAY